MVRPLDTRPVRRYKVYSLYSLPLPGEPSRYLYLGMTSEPLQRRYDRHARQNPWFAEVDLSATDCALFETREQAQAEYDRRRKLARQPRVNPDPELLRERKERAVAAAKERQARKARKPSRTSPHVLQRIIAGREELREAERGMGFPAGTAVRAADGSIDWDWDRLKALGVV